MAANTKEINTNDSPAGGKYDNYDMEDMIAREKAVIRKIDWRLIPSLSALYTVAIIDRGNISNARIAGMEEDLQLNVGNRFSVALLVFFIPYLLFELPSNIILRQVGGANWLCFLAFCWGAFMLGQGFITNYPSLVVFRLILGLFEAGFFPGCVYLISCWYQRYEVQKRLAAFYLSSVLLGAFGGILAFGLMQMEGIRGHRGWRWIFIVEGALTLVIAIISWFYVPAFPHDAQKDGFLNEQEAKLVQDRIDRDRQDASPDSLTMEKVIRCLCDVKIWMFSLMLTSTAVPIFGLYYFSPVIIKGMGYSASVANLLTTGPYCFAVASAYFFSWLGDKWHIRGPFIVIQAIITIVGLMLVAYHPHHGVRFFGLFLGIAGCQGNVPTLLAYQSNNIRMQSKRAVASAVQLGFGAGGGIIASTIFRQADAPAYVPGLWTTAGLQFLLIGVFCVTEYYLWKKNKEVDEGKATMPIEGLEGFRYTL
ncbi:hypothetical protein LOZ66_003890 [Ophidiomyces ophidiicola]|nr:hypothetical protein LOZ66_003890 [Ophidiomyces ophidiicola]